MVSKYGIQIVFIDYLGLTRSGQTRMQLSQELGVFTETIRETAIANGILKKISYTFFGKDCSFAILFNAFAIL